MTRTRRGAETRGDANYPTPDWAIRRFLEEWPDLHTVGSKWIEPCAGDGVIVDVVNEFRSDIDWTVVEKRPTHTALRNIGLKSSQIWIGDFFNLYPEPDPCLPGKTPPEKPFDVAILNPAFYLTMPFIHRLLHYAKVLVVMQRVNFCGSTERNEWVRSNVPDLYMIPNRVSFTGTGRTDAIEHGWHVWGPHPNVGVGEYRILKDTPIDERNRSYRRIVRARDEVAITLDALFDEVIP